MKTSNKGKAIIKEFEGLHDGDLTQIGLQPKMDPTGIWTEGWGRAMRGPDGKYLRYAKDKKLAYARATIKTLDQAEKALDEDLIPCELEVIRKLKIKVNQNQFDALVSHFYNTGGSATLFDLINNRSSKTAIYKWWTERYITSNGKVYPGLVRRRKMEAELFFS